MTARRICRSLPLPDEEREALGRVLAEAGAYHDIGKAAAGFQRMLREDFSWRHRHETLSTALAFRLNPQLDPCALFAILTHHRSIPADGVADGERCLPGEELPPRFGGSTDRYWRQMVEELHANWELLADLLARVGKSLGLPQQDISSETPLTEFGLDAAWLDRRFRRQQAIPKELKLRASLLRGLLITSDHMASAFDPQTRAHIRPLDVPRLADHRAAVERRELPEGKMLLPFQRRVAELEGDGILKAPTGSGKTLAALLWAAHNQAENGRFFYVLPYTASINAMADRLRSIYVAAEGVGAGGTTGDGSSYVGVLHHRNADYLFRTMEAKEEDLSPQLRNRQAKLLSNLAREMYHPIRVCTPHQILRFALRGRGWEIGLSEFRNACFVFDEVHAFEPLLAGLTLATVRLLKRTGARVLFASATIPRLLDRKIREHGGIVEAQVVAPDPLDEADREACGKVRHRVEVRAGSLLDNLSRVADEIEASGETALIVCNHVAVSQQVWREMRGRGFDAALLHARFNGEDRNRIEKAITGVSKPPVLVATQAVEVSLDISYGRGYTEPAPADALGQRFGRVNRKGERPRPAPVVVFDQPSAGYLYDQALTDRTVELLRGVGELTEAQLTEIVDAVYGDEYSPAALEDFNRGNGNELINEFESSIVAGTYRKWTEDVLERSDGQVEVLPDCLLEKFKNLRDEKRYVEAGQLLVPIRVGQQYRAIRSGALRYDKNLGEYVTRLSYSHESGLDLTAESENVI